MEHQWNATGLARVDESLDRTIRENEEVVSKVMKLYCSDDLLREYQEYGHKENSFIEGFKEAVRATLNNMINLQCQAQILEKQDKKINSEKPLDLKKCKDPLAKMLMKTKGVNPTESIFEHMKRTLWTWGLKDHGIAVLIHYKEVLRSNNQKFSSDNGNSTLINSSYSNCKKKGDAFTGSSMDWSALKQVSIHELRLFKQMKGAFLQGLLVSESMTMTSVMNILQDTNGDYITVCFYNCMPEVNTSISISEKSRLGRERFPKGTQIAIANPYYKVAIGSNRVVRVDDPLDIKFITPITLSVTMAKDAGNKASVEGQYATARKEYMKCFNHSEIEDQINILANRCQCYLNQEQYHDALADAATVLSIKPDHQKCWMRYTTALEGIGFPDLASSAKFVFQRNSAYDKEDTQTPLIEDYKQKVSNLRDVLVTVAKAVYMVGAEVMGPHEKDILQMPQDAFKQAPEALIKECKNIKVEADNLFRSKDYDNAIYLYSFALHTLNELQPLAMVLNNLAQVCQEQDMHADVISYTLGVMRLGRCHEIRSKEIKDKWIMQTEKAKGRMVRALLSLGERETARIIGEEGQERNSKQLENLLNQNNAQVCLQDTLFSDLKMLICDSYIPYDLIHPGLEILAINKKKGRGVFTRERLQIDTVAMVCRSTISANNNLSKAKSQNMSFNQQTQNTSSHNELRTRIVNRVSEDACFAWRLSHLCYEIELGTGREHQYSDSKLRVFPMENLMESLSPISIPYLPSGPQYVSVQKMLKSEQVQRLLDTNCHGTGFSTEESSELYPSVALQNHSHTPNCMLDFVNDKKNPIVLLVIKEIQPGEELTISYGTDKEVLNKKWGIRN